MTGSGEIHGGLRVVAVSEGFGEPELSLEIVRALRILPGRRQVYAAKIVGSGAKVAAKRYLPHARQARDWRREWEGLAALRRLALPAPAPLAVVEDRGGAVWVLMHWLEGAVGLGDAVEAADGATLEALARDLVALVDRMHAAGVKQTDQHLDNWTVVDGRMHLLDAGGMRFASNPLAPGARLSDLAAICVTLPPRLEDAFRVRLAADYLRDEPAVRNHLLSRLERAIIDVQRQRTRRYARKTLRDCTEFKRAESPDYLGMHDRQADTELVRRFFADPESLMREGSCLKAGNTCTVQGIQVGGARYVLKRYNRMPFWTRLRRSFAPSRALRSWSNARVLEMGFVPTARALAFAEARAGILRGRCYLLMEHVEGVLLSDFAAEQDAASPELEAAADSVARIWAALGRMRGVHGDLKATNWIVDGAGKAHLFDLDAFRFGLSGAAYRRGRARDRRRFMRNWSERPELAALFEAKLTAAEGEA